MSHKLDGKVLVRNMPNRAFPEMVALADLQKMDLKDCTVTNSCFSVEVDDPTKTWKGVQVFKSCTNVTFLHCNLANVDQAGWVKCKMAGRTTAQRFKADKTNGNLDRKVNAVGNLEASFIDGRTLTKVKTDLLAEAALEAK